MSPTQSRWPAPLLLKLRNRHFLFWDLIALPLAAYLAFVLRLTSFDLGPYGPTALVAAVVAPAVKLPIFGRMGGYSRYWPFASLPELELLVWAPLFGEGVSVVAGLVLLAALGFQRMPWSVPVIELLLTVAFLAGPRFAVRMIYRAVTRRGATPKGTLRVLIAGAGEGGNLVVQELQRNPQLGLEPAGFVDDAPAKQGLTIHGVRVWGPISAIPRLVKQHQISRVLVAIPTATSAEMRTIVGVCHEAGVEVLTLPGVFELISGQVEIRRFRPVQVEDLLARDPVKTDTTGIHLLLAGKVVLITGAGGSIGSELCRQVAACGPAHLVVLGHGENSIFHIERRLRATYPTLTITPVIADVRDEARLGRLFASVCPDVVVHAAAHKHVPLMEANPEEAIINNVGGTRALLRAAERAGVSAFVLISTDKAVNPTSVMGATKRIAEQLVQETARRTGRRFVSVRFGNVLGSRGSVVPLFQEQIAAGGPIRVTHPEMTRYFMTIPEAVQLVLQAAALGEGGEVFVLDMGEPVKIVDLARDMIRLAGLREDKDIRIEFTGLRPGEKLFEEIFLDDEHHTRTVHEKVFVSRNGHLPPNGAGDTPLFSRVDELLAAAEAGDTLRLYGLIRALVPECAASLGMPETIGEHEDEEAGIRPSPVDSLTVKHRSSTQMLPTTPEVDRSPEGNSPRDKRWAFLHFAAVVICLPPLILTTQFPLWAQITSLVGLILISLFARLGRRPPVPRTPIDLPVCALLLLLPGNLLVSADQSLTLPHVYKVVASTWLFYATVEFLRDTKWFGLGTWAICLLGLTLVPVVLFGTAWGGGNKLSWLPLEITAHFPRLFRPFWKPVDYPGFNPNMTGGTLAMLLPVPVALCFYARDLRARLLAGAGALAMGGTLVLTQSRGAMLATLAGICALLIAKSWRWAIVLALLFAGGALLLNGTGALTIAPSPGVEADVQSAVDSAKERLELWSRAWYMMQDFAFTGIGMGMVPRVLPILYPTFLIPITADMPHLHSLYLNTGAELGFPGLIALCALLVDLLVLSWLAVRSARRTHSSLEPLALGLFGMQIVLCTHGLVDTITTSSYIHLIAWGLLGVAVAVDTQCLRVDRKCRRANRS